MSTDAKPSESDPVAFPGGALRCGKHVIAPWPSLQVSPPQGFLRGDDLLRPGAGAESFVRMIPPQLLHQVRAFPACHWRLLELCAGHPVRGWELLAENPALAMLTVDHCNHSAAHLRRRDLIKLVNRPWRGLLADLGLPTRPRTIRILRKLSVEYCTCTTVSRLRRVLRTSGHPWVHVLPHLPLVTRDTVGLLSQDPQIVSPTLIWASLNSTPDLETVSWLCSTIRDLRTELGHTGPWPYRGLNLEQLKLVEGQLTTRTIPAYFAVFPPPPFAGRPKAIVPILDFAGLAEEGGRQANCAVMYLSSILAQEAFVYQLLQPERATFVLQRSGKTAPWALADLRGIGNAAPADSTLAYVKNWIQDSQVANDGKPPLAP